MSLASLFVDIDPVIADLIGLAAMPLGGRHEPDSAVAVIVVVPVHECRHPEAGVVLAAERSNGVIRLVLERAEQRFRVRVVLADPWSGEGSEHTQRLQTAVQHGRFHGVAVVGMEDQRLVAPTAKTPFSTCRG